MSDVETIVVNRNAEAAHQLIELHEKRMQEMERLVQNQNNTIASMTQMVHKLQTEVARLTALSYGSGSTVQPGG